MEDKIIYVKNPIESIRRYTNKIGCRIQRSNTKINYISIYQQEIIKSSKRE